MLHTNNQTRFKVWCWAAIESNGLSFAPHIFLKFASPNHLNCFNSCFLFSSYVWFLQSDWRWKFHHTTMLFKLVSANFLCENNGSIFFFWNYQENVMEKCKQCILHSFTSSIYRFISPNKILKICFLAF